MNIPRKDYFGEILMLFKLDMGQSGRRRLYHYSSSFDCSPLTYGWNYADKNLAWLLKMKH